jgi:hypothetical protein
VNILCIAKEHNGIVPNDYEEIGWTLRIPPLKAKAILGQLIERRLFDVTDRGLQPHDWSEHQFENDLSSQRVVKYRKKLVESGSSPYAMQKLRPVILERDKMCAYCGSAEKLVIDHIVPVIRGGWTAEDNLIAACKGCNAGKAGRLPHEAGLTPITPEFQNIVTLAVTEWSRLQKSCHGDRNGTVTCSEAEAEQIQNRADTETEQKERRRPPLAKWPLAAAAIRDRFPTADDALVFELVELARTAAPEVDDGDMPAVIEAATRPGQKSAALYRKTVPEVVRSWR